MRKEVKRKIRTDAEIILPAIRTPAYTSGMVAMAVELPVMQQLDVARMRKLREAAGLTQAQAAERAKMAVTRWNDIEAGGRSNITISTLSVIADALGVDACDLLTRSNRKRAAK